MKRIAALLTLFIGLLPTLAVGQVNTQNLPANTVIGRLGIPTQGGPAQAIPFAALVQALAAAEPTCAANTVMAGPTTGPAAKPACRSLVTGDIPPGAIPSSTTMGFGTRALAVAATIPTAVTSVFLQGYTTANDGGGGWYSKLAGVPGPVKAWHFQSADGAYWQLTTANVYPKQVNAKLDNATDDTTAMQAWLDYGSTFNVPSMGQSGTAVIPTGSLFVNSNNYVDGLGVLTLKRTTNIVAAMMQCQSQSNVNVAGLSFTTTAGFSGTGSNTINIGAGKVFTVPAGLNLVVSANSFVVVRPTSTLQYYMVARVTGYTGTTLTLESTSLVGSGTFSAWSIDVYTLNTADGNWAMQWQTCPNSIIRRNTITGRYYAGIDVRDSTNTTIEKNKLSGTVDRGIYVNATTGSGTIQKQTVFDNDVDGAGNTLYCIQATTNSPGTMVGLSILGNNARNCLGQGISMGGAFSFSSINGNSIISTIANGAGLLCQLVLGGVPQSVSMYGNNINGAANGILVTDCQDYTLANNTVTGSSVGAALNGTTSSSNSFSSMTGNMIRNSTGDGLQLTGSVAGGVTGITVAGNTVFNNGGTGIISNANTTNSVFTGNVVLNNTTAQCNLSGTGHVNSGNKGTSC